MWELIREAKTTAITTSMSNMKKLLRDIGKEDKTDKEEKELEQFACELVHDKISNETMKDNFENKVACPPLPSPPSSSSLPALPCPALPCPPLPPYLPCPTPFLFLWNLFLVSFLTCLADVRMLRLEVQPPQDQGLEAVGQPGT
eukprot:194701-Hanusia_phi.AAC.1